MHKIQPRIKNVQAVSEAKGLDFDVHMNIGNGVRKGKLVSINESLGVAKVLGADGKTRIVATNKITRIPSVNESKKEAHDVSVSFRNGNNVTGKLMSINESASIAHVKFNDGSVKIVPMDKINVLDEASVMDTIKKGAQNVWDKTKETVSNLFTGLKKAYGTVVKFFNGKFVNATGPVQAAVNQTNGNTPEGVIIYPSNATMKEAASVGAPVSKVNVSEKDVDPEEVKEIEDFWMNVMGRANDHAEKFDAEDEADLPSEMVEEAYKYFTKLHYGKLNEAVDILQAEEGTGIPDYSFNEIVDYLTDIFASVQEYNEEVQKAYEREIAAGKTSGVYIRDLVDREKYVPRAATMIWGAPGIGKTQLVRQLVHNFNNAIEGAQWDCFELDAAHLTPDDFTLPKVSVKEVKDDEGNVIDEIMDAKDIVKDWLPMFVQTGNPAIDLEGLRQANGPSNGGVLFIDEFSRVRGDTAQVFMNIIQDQKLGNRFLGPAWLIVCAGNRKKDMGRAVDFSWDSAWSTRFMQMNYVPEKSDWVKWARSVGINPIIVDWIDSPQGDSFWYEDLSKTRTGLKDRMLKAEPRSLVQTANMFDLKERQRSSNSKFAALRKMQKDKGLSSYEMYRIAEANLGKDAAINFKKWLESQRNFTDEDAKQLITEGFDKMPDSKLALVKDDITKQANLKVYARTVVNAFNNTGDDKDDSELNKGMPYRLPTNFEMLQVFKLFDFLADKSVKSKGVSFIEAYNEFSDILVRERGMSSGSTPNDQEKDPRNYYTDYLHSPEMSSEKFLGLVALEGDEDVAGNVDDIKAVIDYNKETGIEQTAIILLDNNTDNRKKELTKQLRDADIPASDAKIIFAREAAPEVIRLCDADNYATDFLISYVVEYKNENPVNWIMKSMDDLGQISTVAEGDDVEKYDPAKARAKKKAKK